ncbi:MAG: acyl-CoA dehydratase activase [Syntrophorhabdales bacterium]|jgi:predicted CoA-substrate-specific enzyme activase
MIVAGIDIGSITTEALLFDREKGLVGYSILLTGADPGGTSASALDKALQEAGRGRPDVVHTVATGCGRRRAAFAEEAVTEITCLAKGVNYLFPGARTVIDIGGQDTKAIRIDATGRVVEFEMNDKCAAGTGRFLEVMASALKIDLDRMGELSLAHGRHLTISSICTVFAESEVISLVSEGEGLPDILHGISTAIADRTMGLVHRLGGIAGEVVMAGGVAKNSGVVRALEEAMGVVLNIPDEPQVVGALGAALLALRKASCRDG